LRRRWSHPLVVRSKIEDITQIDVTARVSNSCLHGEVQVGAHASLDACTMRGNNKISIGVRSIITGPVRIISDLNTISIGNFCSLAPDVAIWEALHCYEHLSTYFVSKEMLGGSWTADLSSKGPIRIGNDCWIGTRSIILSGVIVGDGAVIGAGSVVTRDVPPYAIVAGAPARIVKFRFNQEMRMRLLAIRWWDWDTEKITRNRELFEGKLSLTTLKRIE
jgi:virginiamycin A acetyltransferase